MEEFKNKKVLIFGLGILGGGVEAAKWFYKRGARLRITDLKKRKDLEKSIKILEKLMLTTRTKHGLNTDLHEHKNNMSEKSVYSPNQSVQSEKSVLSPPKSAIRYILGKHRKEDIDWADIVYVNPGVSYKNEFIQYAIKKKKEIVNDCYLFFKYSKGDIIAITGTRGKTTTTTWIYEILTYILKEILNKSRININVLLGGNQPEHSLFKILDKTNDKSISVLELSSFQLEFYKKNLKAPKIAIITCLLRDHLNRYKNMKEYAKVKGKIFMNQTESDYLILNYDNEWTNYFLSLSPKSQIYFVSAKRKLNRGIYVNKNCVYIKDNREIKILDIKNFKEIYGEHNLYNLLFSILACYLYIKDKNKNFREETFNKLIKKFIKNLKTPKFRQEIIFTSKNLMIINDSASTTPDATIAALKRFSLTQKYTDLTQKYIEQFSINYPFSSVNSGLILIAGGTDKNLDFKDLAKEIKKRIKPENLILINGSATKKLIKELISIKYQINKENIVEDLKDAILKALKQFKNLNTNQSKNRYVILFSPGAASFEKFKNEFDRGEKFNKLIKQKLKNFIQ